MRSFSVLKQIISLSLKVLFDFVCLIKSIFRDRDKENFSGRSFFICDKTTLKRGVMH